MSAFTDVCERQAVTAGRWVVRTHRMTTERARTRRAGVKAPRMSDGAGCLLLLFFWPLLLLFLPLIAIWVALWLIPVTIEVLVGLYALLMCLGWKVGEIIDGR